MHYPARRRLARAPHAVHLEPGRLRGRLPVLRDRRARASGATSRRPRSSTRSATRARRLAADGQRLTNIVFMGMGEPLLNLDRVLAAVEALNDRAPVRAGRPPHHGLDLRASCPGIRRLTALGPQFTLAVSLHAARDPLRDVLVPLNRRWPVAEVVAAARDHARATGRRISYEVTMIGGVNDTDRRRRRRWPTCCAATTPTSTSSR